MVRRQGTRAHRDAPALRFLLLCIAGWTAFRLAANWNPAAPEPPLMPARAWATQAIAGPAQASARPRRRTLAIGMLAPSAAAGRRVDGPGRHAPGPAPTSGLPASSPGRASSAAVPGPAPSWRGPHDFPPTAGPASGGPFWMRRDLSGWSASAWAFVRSGAGAAPEAVAAAGQIGGSQTGLRIAYGLGRDGRAHAYGRATVALDRPRQREFAAGIAFAPVPALPVDIAVEQRVAAGSEGRTALAAMAFGGVGDVALPAGFRLEAYAQAGVVGAQRLDGFADGAVVVDHRIGSNPSLPFSVGALAAGAVQPGAARLDVGPRLTLRLPRLAKGSRIAIDWRQRIAGDAVPGSGVAVTLAADF